jgi:hypothetical protein
LDVKVNLTGGDGSGISGRVTTGYGDTKTSGYGVTLGWGWHYETTTGRYHMGHDGYGCTDGWGGSVGIDFDVGGCSTVVISLDAV